MVFKVKGTAGDETILVEISYRAINILFDVLGTKFFAIDYCPKMFGWNSEEQKEETFKLLKQLHMQFAIDPLTKEELEVLEQIKCNPFGEKTT